MMNVFLQFIQSYENHLTAGNETDQEKERIRGAMFFGAMAVFSCIHDVDKLKVDDTVKLQILQTFEDHIHTVTDLAVARIQRASSLTQIH
jgi:hypothetical protein